MRVRGTFERMQRSESEKSFIGNKIKITLDFLKTMCYFIVFYKLLGSSECA